MHERNKDDEVAGRAAGEQSPSFTIVDFRTDEDLAKHLYKSGQRKPTDFLCLDARASGIDSVLAALESIAKYESENLDGFMPPRVVVAERGNVLPENLEKLACSGAYLLETSNGCAAVDFAKQQLAELFAASTAAAAVGQPPQRGPQPAQSGAPANASSELAAYIFRPEGFDGAALTDLYHRSSTPDSPLKDD